MVKTGREVFKAVVYDKINGLIKVERIIDATDSNYYIVQICELKWLRNGSFVTLNNTVTFAVSEIDYSLKTVKLTKLNPLDTLVNGDVLQLEFPAFNSGTPLNYNKERQMTINAAIQVAPINIWLLESIKGSRPLKTEYMGYSFDFVFYILYDADLTNTLNAQRHETNIRYATQIRAEIERVLDETNGVFRTSELAFRELPIFGKETENGIEQYIIDANMSGIECRVSVRVTTEFLCKC